MVIRIDESKSTGRRVGARRRAAGCYRIPVSECLRGSGAGDSPRPVNSVGLDWIGAAFDQPCSNHTLPRRLVDLDEHLAHVVIVASGLAEENCVGSFVDLRRIFALKLGSDQWRNVLGPSITKLIIVAL